MIHAALRTPDFKEQVSKARSRKGREHTTLWTADLDGEFWRMFPNGDVPEEAKVRISKYGVNSVHLGRLHVRDLKAFTDVDRMSNEDALGVAMAIKSEVEAMGGEMKGSGAATAFNLWRERFNAGKPWRNVNIETPDWRPDPVLPTRRCSPGRPSAWAAHSAFERSFIRARAGEDASAD